MTTNLFTRLALLMLMSVAACQTPTPRLDIIALGSCNVQLLPQTYWAQISNDHPDLFIFAGDNVYGDLEMVDGAVKGGPGRPELMAAAYEHQGSLPLFQKFRASVPIHAIWDDHDFGENDAGASYAHRASSEQQFLDFWNIAEEDERRSRPGLYTSSLHGPKGERVQIIILDTRYFRSDLVKDADKPWLNTPDDNRDKTILGADQWAWLKQMLSVEADVRLIVSSIQVHAEGHRFERWGNFPHELKKLYALIDETGANGAVFLSGDRHSAALYARQGEGRYPILEMTSSSLNNPTRYPGSGEMGPHQLGALYDEANYGIVALNWETRTLALQIKSMSGDIVRSQSVSIDDLR